jgi:Uma2 family endonuclease
VKETFHRRKLGMASNLAQDKPSYTYEDYRGFPDDLRCEILDGEIYDMTPAPTTVHQAVALRIVFFLERDMESKGHPCRVFMAPTDVILSDKDVVQPDVLIICDRSKIKEAGIFGAPDVLFEVISPSTETKDRKKKRNLFERFGVKEYFMVHPDRQYVEKYTLDAGIYKKPELYEEDETFRIDTIELELKARDLFALPE